MLPPIETLTFTALAGLALGSAGVVAFSRNIIHSALALLGTFLGVADTSRCRRTFSRRPKSSFTLAERDPILFVMLTARIEDMKVSNPSQGLLVAIGLVSVVMLVLGKVATSTSCVFAATQPVDREARSRFPR